MGRVRLTIGVGIAGFSLNNANTGRALLTRQIFPFFFAFVRKIKALASSLALVPRSEALPCARTTPGLKITGWLSQSGCDLCASVPSDTFVLFKVGLGIFCTANVP